VGGQQHLIPKLVAPVIVPMTEKNGIHSRSITLAVSLYLIIVGAAAINNSTFKFRVHQSTPVACPGLLNTPFLASESELMWHHQFTNIWTP